jgi:TatD DNase family protein
MKIFESHAHLDFADYNDDRAEVLRLCREAGVSHFVNIGIDEATSLAAIALSEIEPDFSAAVGFHPAECPSYDRGKVINWIVRPRVKAIGEIGLDYYRDHHPRDMQIRVFEDQVRLAIEHDMPIVVHDREAHDDCLRILEAYRPARVVFHCFSGDESMAERVFANGWMVSFTGTITYKNNTLTQVIRMAPSDRYMVETDCPFLAPAPYRGKRNAPFHLPLVIARIADVRGTSPETVAAETWANGLRFFGLNDNDKSCSSER